MFDFLTTCRALADENRIRILMALRGRQLCVCQVTAFLDLAPSTTSKHLSILRQARLIESNKQGRWVYYRLADDSPRPNIREALAWMKDSLTNDPTIIEDEARIAEILRAEEACGFGHGESDCFHSLEVHSLAQRFENAPQEEEKHD
ncbi:MULTISPECIES: ArsR/SmtB family transcription factor [Bilophila]|uniref:ArsR/SmtB family transcription factor n=1 Tax=Bilophila TaxID=35832 RepID=UPI00257996AE|nr:metalloregulator ArsR/SmtB family transcription factor [Bilophila sp.]MBS5455246.1 winged helix-turn-helix transcriptional regulator [Bilophila sp.]